MATINLSGQDDEIELQSCIANAESKLRDLENVKSLKFKKAELMAGYSKDIKNLLIISGMLNYSDSVTINNKDFELIGKYR